VRFDAGFNDPRPDRASISTPEAPVLAAAPFNAHSISRVISQWRVMRPSNRFSAFVQVLSAGSNLSLLPAQFHRAQPPPHRRRRDQRCAGGLRFAAIASGLRNLTFQLGADFPTGNGDNGLATNHYRHRAKILLFQRLSDRTAIEAEAGDSIPSAAQLITQHIVPPAKLCRRCGHVRYRPKL